MSKFDWGFVGDIFPQMLSGLWVTLQITVIVIIISMDTAIP